MGISEANQSKLFKLFGKLKDSQCLNQQGLGLGLTICKKISESMGGLIQVSSAPGQGSTFTFFIELFEMKYVTVKDTSCMDEEDQEMEFADIYKKDVQVEEYMAHTQRVDFQAHWPGSRRDIYLSSSQDTINRQGNSCKCCSILVVDDNAFNILAIQFLLE